MIKNVNGRNVYVLDTGPVTGKTTSGKNWANLYSDLRWKVYEEVKKDQIAQMKLEGMAYKAQVDIYASAAKDIRKNIADLHKLKAEVLTGGTTAYQAAILRGKDVDRQNKRDEAKAELELKQQPKTTTKKWTETHDRFGQKLRGGSIEKKNTTTTQYGTAEGGTVSSKEIKLPDEPRLAGGALGSGGTGSAYELSSLDRGIAELQAQLDGLEKPEFNIDGSINNRTRRAYERDVGVMGKGGGAFGLAPRPNRMLPRVDEPLAQERIDKFVKDMEGAQDQAAADWSAEKQKRKSLLDNALFLEMSGDAKDAEDAVKTRAVLDELNKANPLADDEQSVRDAVKSTAVDRLKEVAPPVDEGDFLRIPSAPKDPRDPRIDPRDRERNRDDRKLFREDRQRRRKERQERRKERRLGDEETNGIPTRNSKEWHRLLDDALDYYEGLSVQNNLNKPTNTDWDDPRFSPESITIEDPIDYFGGKRKMIKQYIQDMKDAAASVEPGNEVAKVQPNTKQRKEKYKLMVVKAGIELSSKPKKLERLAKASLENDKRPKHIAVVDKIYEANKDKKDAFAASFAEISRAFADDPGKRQEAHVYLVAKDSLENQKKEPLA